jgi:hypothetical protein
MREPWRAAHAGAVSPRRLGRRYYTTLDPLSNDENAGQPLLVAGDLVEVWADVKQGLVALELGAPEVDVLWGWRFLFYSHWGRHATDALHALHARIAETGGPLEPEIVRADDQPAAETDTS